MTVPIDIQANEIIETMSQGKIKYETKQALKKGFNNLHESIVYKLSGEVISKSPTPKTPTRPEVTGWKKEINCKKTFNWEMIIKIIVENRNKKDVVKDLVPNKEMFERWLLDVGSKSPNDFEIGDGFKMGTTQTLLYQIMFFTGQFGVDIDHPSYNKNHVYEWFRDLQHLIQNNEMYWLLFAKFYLGNEISLNTIEINKPDRNKVSLVSRIRSVHRLYDGSPDKNESSLENHLRYLSQYDDEDEISIFRSFSVQTRKYDDNGKLVHKGQPVRKGITRLSDESGIHMEGRGYSYSISKAIAMRLGHPINIPIIKKQCKVDDKEALKILSKWTNKSQREYIQMYDGFYRAIGHFTVKKKHIKLLTNTGNELEVIANPDDVVLKDYRFLTGLDLIATSGFFTIVESGCKNRFTNIVFLDWWYDAFHWEIKRTLDRNQTLSKELIKNALRKKDMDRLIDGVSNGFYNTIHGKPRVNDTFGFVFSTDSNGRIFLSVHGHLILPQKKTTLYQKRVFDFKEITYTDKSNLGFLNNFSSISSTKLPKKAWYDKFSV